MWRSTDNGATWTQLTASAEWSIRGAHSSVVVPDGSIVLMGGSNTGNHDTWRFSPVGSSAQNPSHIYTAPGSYQVALQVYNADGYNGTRKVGYITVMPALPARTGVYRSGMGFYLKNNNESFWAPWTGVTGPPWQSDKYLAWDDAAADLPIAGDWNIDGLDETGIYRPGVGFFLKMDAGFTWNQSTDRYLGWDNAAIDLPIAGDWNADGRTETGVYRPGSGFYLKMDNSGTWNPSTDQYLAWDDAAADLPIAGDWNIDGLDETGVYRPGVGFFLKMDNGSSWTPSTDKYLAWDNYPLDLPIAGDWNADGRTETGVYRPGAGFFLKMDNGSSWTSSTDKYLAWDNAYGDLPIAGKWAIPTQPAIRILFASDLTIFPGTNVSIPVGGKVIWVNSDPLHPHGIVALDTQTGNYFGGMYPVQIPYSKTFEVTFDTIGEFAYETTFQPHVAGAVIVY